MTEMYIIVLLLTIVTAMQFVLTLHDIGELKDEIRKLKEKNK